MSEAPKYNVVQRMFRFTGMERGMKGVFFCVVFGGLIGGIIDRSSTQSMVIYRDRSALYAGKNKDGQPSWPSKEAWWLS